MDLFAKVTETVSRDTGERVPTALASPCAVDGDALADGLALRDELGADG